MKNKRLILCILDGWGLRDEKESNAIALGYTPNFDYLIRKFPNSKLRTDGIYVGLPENQVGNSEVGHTTIGSGRKVLMSLPKIDKSIKEGSLMEKEAIQNFVNALKRSGGVAHLMGLVSDGGVHAHKNHMVYFANSLAEYGIPVALHCFLDGRDVLPKSAKSIIQELENDIDECVKVVTLIGRFYAMDRDNRWDRIEKCYRLLVDGSGERFDTAAEGIDSKYQQGQTDEFIEPIVVRDYRGFAEETDGLFFLNYRSDRARQITEALFSEKFKKFKRKKNLNLAAICGLVEYHENFRNFMEPVFKTKKINNTLGQLLSKHNKKQFRLAETEKYPHVTFFFNAGFELVSEGETRIMIPSPKVLTYDKKPAMSAVKVTKSLLQAIETEKYDFILVNYANPDMVGHTGDLAATIESCEIIDKCLGEVINSAQNTNAVLFVTSDHGNCELMYDKLNNSKHTAHTLSLVPFIAVGLEHQYSLRSGDLSDIAPTILEVLGMEKPEEMTGQSLIKK